ncbi:CLUMA_CG017127, isoform A [Clunio marinus]|uniref:CLUMA_CG017127, isoform A n=1 Tax=Clunio marinus TaxID=568069 RepID=A0A1J1IZK6_9DIPT|nr:CLUMA_CG017127, isoform A [Clunio marinus]
MYSNISSNGISIDQLIKNLFKCILKTSLKASCMKTSEDGRKHATERVDGTKGIVVYMSFMRRSRFALQTFSHQFLKRFLQGTLLDNELYIKRHVDMPK